MANEIAHLDSFFKNIWENIFIIFEIIHEFFNQINDLSCCVIKENDENDDNDEQTKEDKKKEEVFDNIKTDKEINENSNDESIIESLKDIIKNVVPFDNQ
jgi:hypothetical protein